MIKRISFSEFQDEFVNYGRGDNFSYDGLKALFDYIEEIEHETGEPQELDVVALCCDFAEYETPQACANDYGIDIEGMETDEIVEELRENTLVLITQSGSVVIQNF